MMRIPTSLMSDWRRQAAVLAAFVTLVASGFPAPAQTAAEPKRDIAAYLLADDAEMNAAIDKARRTLPRFVSIHQSRRNAPEKLEFLALAAVDDGVGGREYRWLENVSLTPDAITGILSEESEASSPHQKGETYRAEPDSIADWLVRTEGGALIGGYTLRVVVSRADDETKRLYEGSFLD